MVTKRKKRRARRAAKVAKNSRKRSGASGTNWKLRRVCWSPADIATSTMTCSGPSTTTDSSTMADSLSTRTSRLQTRQFSRPVLFANSPTDTRLCLRVALCAWIGTTDVKWALDWLGPYLISTTRTTRQTMSNRIITKKNCLCFSCPKAKGASFPTR